MKSLRLRVRESYIGGRFSRLSLGLIPALISFELALSLVVGYFIALFFAGSRTHMRGRIPSFIFQFRQHRVHLHHWLVASNILAVALIFNFFVLTPFLFYGFLSGIVAQGVIHYEDWYSVIKKV